MKTRPLTRKDLPKTRRSVNSLKIPVLYKDRVTEVVDIHYGENSLCYIKDPDSPGVPVSISDLQLILSPMMDFEAILRSDIIAAQSALNRAKLTYAFYSELTRQGMKRGAAFKLAKREDVDSYFNDPSFTDEHKKEMMFVLENYNSLVSI